MRKIYSYLVFETYNCLHKSYPINAINRTSSCVSIFLFVNLISLSLLIEKHLNKHGFIVILIIAIIISFLTLNFLNERNIKLMISESENIEIGKFWKFVIKYYPEISILFFLISAKASIEIIITFFGIYLLYKLIEIFSKM